MALCEFQTLQTTEEHSPLFMNTECVYVPINQYGYAQKRGELDILIRGTSGEGLLTTGAGPCMVVIVHHTTLKKGALAHINICSKPENSYRWADMVLYHMLETVNGAISADNIQIILCQGQGTYSGGYFQHISNQPTLRNCRIDNHLNNGIPDYLYFAAGDILYPINKNEICHSLKHLKVSELTFPNRKGVFTSAEYLINFNNQWGNFM